MENEKLYTDYINQINALEEKFHEEEKKCLKAKKTWEECVEATREIKLQEFLLDKEARLIQPPGLEAIKKLNGSIITIEKFLEMAKNGQITDSDTLGYYSNGENKTDVVILPSDVEFEKIRTDFTHVFLPKNHDI